MTNVGFAKRKLNPNAQTSVNLLDFGYAKNCQNLTVLEFRFDLRHKPGGTYSRYDPA